MRTGGIATTYVRGGTYHLTQTLDLDGRDDGHTFAAYQDETPVISGGEVVRGFRSEGNGLFSAPLTTPSDLDLVIGGVRQHVAQSAPRDPAAPTTSGWSVLGQAEGGASKHAFTFHDADLPATLTAHPGVKVQAFDHERLADSIADVASIDRESHTITLGQEAPYVLRTGGTYRLLNAPALIRDPGDFAWRASDQRLLVKPEHPDSFEQDGVVVPRLGTLVAIKGAHGVTLSGLTFADGRYDGAAVALSGGGGNAIGGNHFTNVGTAVSLDGSTGNRIAGNVMRNLGDSGITLVNASDDNRIYANTIEHIGAIIKRGGGITAVGSSHLTISHNDIVDSARYGVSLKEWGDGQQSNFNTVAHNRILHTGQETADGGGIEMLGRSGRDTHSVIRGNYLDDTGGLATKSGSGAWLQDHKGWGISLDDLTSGVTVTDNVVKGASWADIFLHGGDHNVVQNNAGLIASPSDAFVRVEWVPKAGVAGTPADNTVTHNRIEAAEPMDHYWTLLSPGTLTLDHNITYNTPGRGPHDRVLDYGTADQGGVDHDHPSASDASTAGGDIHDVDWSGVGTGAAGYVADDALPLFW